MKIDKVIFACSPSTEYSPFWNLQAKIYATKLGIEPVCLLFGKKADTTMTEDHGKIFEIEADPSLPWSVQLTWSKFHYPTTEPETTWLMGDIDLLPLQRHHFIDKIAEIPDTAYVHLNASGIANPRRGRNDAFLAEGSERHAKDRGVQGGADLPGHYHVAKGKKFEMFTQGRPFIDQVRHIVESDRYGLGVMGNWPKEKKKEDPYWYHWCAEENYSSEIMTNEIRSGSLHFVPIYYNNNNDTDRVNRDAFTSDYAYSRDRAAALSYVDVHCARPYSRQEEQLARLLNATWGI